MTAVFGTVSARDDRFDLEFVRVYATSVEDVWSAVTEAERLARWMAPYVGDLRLGGRWQALNDDGSAFSEGTVTQCDPPHRYVTTWEYEGERPSAVVVTVEPHPEGALLRLRHEGLADVGYGAGWQTYLEQLDDTLPVGASCEVDPDRGSPGWRERFTELEPLWRERLAAAGVPLP